MLTFTSKMFQLMCSECVRRRDPGCLFLSQKSFPLQMMCILHHVELNFFSGATSTQTKVIITYILLSSQLQPTYWCRQILYDMHQIQLKNIKVPNGYAFYSAYKNSRLSIHKQHTPKWAPDNTHSNSLTSRNAPHSPCSLEGSSPHNSLFTDGKHLSTKSTIYKSSFNYFTYIKIRMIITLQNFKEKKCYGWYPENLMYSDA
jgi:hypothetical protein